MIQQINLRKGHVALYRPEDEVYVSALYIVVPHRKLLLGACAAEIADSTFQKYSTFIDPIVPENYLKPDELDLTLLRQRMIDSESGFEKLMHRPIRDNMCGEASACTDRYYYWEVAKLPLKVRVDITVPVWLIVAHHLWHFRYKMFNYTFRGIMANGGSETNIVCDKGNFIRPVSYLLKGAKSRPNLSYEDW